MSKDPKDKAQPAPLGKTCVDPTFGFPFYDPDAITEEIPLGELVRESVKDTKDVKEWCPRCDSPSQVVLNYNEQCKKCGYPGLKSKE